MGLVDDLPGMAYRCRNDHDWTMEFVSAGARELTGYDAAEFTAPEPLSYAGMIHAEDRDRVWAEVQRSLEDGRPFQVTYRLHTASGETKWVWEQGRGISTDGELAHLEGFIVDVTERKEAEERFQRVFESSPMGMYIYERESEERLVLRAANPAADAILGVDHAALIGLPIEEAFPGLAHTEIPVTYRRLATEGGTWHAPEIPYDGNGIAGAFEVVAFQTISGQVAVVYQDITERKERERELRKLSMAVEQAAGSVLMTGVDGAIEYVNASFEQVSGYSRSEVLGENPRMLKSGKHGDAFYRDLWETVLAGGTWRGVFVNRRKDESLYHEKVTISPLRDDTGEIVQLLSIGRDISKEIELEEQVRQAQRLESVGRLAGGVAHDFNNVLTVIMANADFALRAAGNDKLPAIEDLEAIKEAGARAARLTRQLLAFSRKQTLELKVTSVNDIVEGLHKMLSRLVRDDIDFVTQLSDDLWNVKVDEGQIEQVIVNLVVNAADAMPGGGRLTIATDNVEVDESHAESHPTFAPGPYVVLSVTDNGIGMDRQTLSRIYEPFFTTKGEGKGTGLGLATVYGIVKQHGGQIWVYSEPGSGTVFRIYLPRVEEEAVAVRPVAATADRLEGSETVLVVDNDEVIARSARRILEGFGYHVLETSDPHRALDMAASHDGEIHLLLTDAIMPGLSGMKLAERFARQRPQAKTLIMSGYAADADALERALQRGAAFVAKPFSAATLARKVRETLDSGD